MAACDRCGRADRPLITATIRLGKGGYQWRICGGCVRELEEALAPTLEKWKAKYLAKV